MFGRPVDSMEFIYNFEIFRVYSPSGVPRMASCRFSSRGGVCTRAAASLKSSVYFASSVVFSILLSDYILSYSLPSQGEQLPKYVSASLYIFWE